MSLELKNTAIHYDEEIFYNQVVDIAHVFGWKVAHFRPAKTEKGWRTAVGADGAGFPDLVLAREGQVIFAELKTDGGQPSAEQSEWLELLSGYLWRPADFDEIVEILR